MYSPPRNQIFHATKSLIEMQVDVANKLGMRTMEGLSNLANLNVHAMHMSLNESMERMHALLSSRTSLEFFSRIAANAQPSASKLLSYGNDVAEIAAGIRDEFFKATQVEVSETGKEMTSILEQIVEHETDSFNNMIHLTKATIKETEAEAEVMQEQAVQAAEKTAKAPRAKAAHNKAAHKGVTHHQVAQGKKNGAATSKKTNVHRKTTH